LSITENIFKLFVSTFLKKEFFYIYSDKTGLIDGIERSFAEKRLLLANVQLVLNAWLIIDNVVELVKFIWLPSI